jgi:hypothetical protein
MPIIVASGGSGTAAAGLSNYAELVASIGAWLNRDDLNDMAPDFIRLTEEELNRVLRVPEMEITETLTIDAERIDLPEDFRKARAFYINSDPRYELEPVTLGTLRTKYAAQTTGRPECYAISGSELVFGPAPDAEYSGPFTYYADIPALTSEDDTNWVLDKHPSLYLYGTLLQAELYGWNDERLPLIRAGFDLAVSQLQAQGNSKQHGAATPRLRSTIRE